jgi:uncharacterized protein
VVTNVTNFGAFVDIGVHQDGLVHISALSDKFVKDPHQVVKTGDIVHVTVLDVDLQRHRISLSMRQDNQAGQGRTKQTSQTPQKRTKPSRHQANGGDAQQTGQLQTAMALAMRKSQKS